MHSFEAMNLMVYRCKEDVTVQECARLMRDHKIGFVPIVDPQDRLLGVVTDRDLAVRVVAEGRPPTTKVGQIATRETLLTCGVDDDLRDVERRMAESQKGRVIVVDAQGHCLGVISLSNIARVENDPQRVSSLLSAVTQREVLQLARPT